MAADLVLIPYHGQPQHDPDEIYRSEAKSGTSHFHAYATLYVIRNGESGVSSSFGEIRCQSIILARKDEPTSRQESSGEVRWTICNLIPFAKRRLSGHESGSSVLPTAERHEEP